MPVKRISYLLHSSLLYVVYSRGVFSDFGWNGSRFDTVIHEVPISQVFSAGTLSRIRDEGEQLYHERIFKIGWFLCEQHAFERNIYYWDTLYLLLLHVIKTLLWMFNGVQMAFIQYMNFSFFFDHIFMQLYIVQYTKQSIFELDLQKLNRRKQLIPILTKCVTLYIEVNFFIAKSQMNWKTYNFSVSPEAKMSCRSITLFLV